MSTKDTAKNDVNSNETNGIDTHRNGVKNKITKIKDVHNQTITNQTMHKQQWAFSVQRIESTNNIQSQTLRYWQDISAFIPLLIFVMFSCLSFSSYGEPEKAPSKSTNQYSVPNIVLNTKVSSIEDVRKVMAEPKLYAEMLAHSLTLTEKEINKQPSFLSVALQSIRAQKNSEHHNKLLASLKSASNTYQFYPYQLHSQTIMLMNETAEDVPFSKSLFNYVTSLLNKSDDKTFVKINGEMGWSLARAENDLLSLFGTLQKSNHMTKSQLINLTANVQLFKVLSNVLPTANQLFLAENDKRFVIEPDVLIKTPNGIEISATIVKKRHKNVSQKIKQPTAFQFSIYANESYQIKAGMRAAAHGYVGVLANTRGKRSSSNTIVPWEHEGEDATAVIDWIIQQDWSDGQVVMYGGSYNGFTQWAAAKHAHPALKTIVPASAASPITGLPIQNNIVITGNYEWAFHVTNNKTMDNSVYKGWDHSNKLNKKLFESGQAITAIDKLDGTPNPWFQKWLQHPSFDSYYQAMQPYKEDYANINIPVLSITGYFDGGQISAIDFMKEHYKYNKNANHTLLIGPYGHYGAQGIPNAQYSNYKLDSVALDKDSEEIAFEWFDHVLFNKPKPALLKDKVNYQLMGSNTWQHSNSYRNLNKQGQTFYLHTNVDKNGQYSLSNEQEKARNSLKQIVDLTDRSTQLNVDPWPLIQPTFNVPNGLVFVTKPMTETMQLAGVITGELSISINKKDVDIGYQLYEIQPDGSAFNLSNYIARASYAHDMSQRKLLTPNQITKIPFGNSYMTAKLLKPGSRLALVLNVNKNMHAQVNMGSGKDVNHETIADAGEPLEIKWLNDSKIHIPLTKWAPNKTSE